MVYRTIVSSPRHTSPPLTVGSMLRKAWTALSNDNHAKLVAAGFDDLRPAHQPVMREILGSNLRPSELAAHLGLSKQAANDLVREFEAKGYIALEPDPDDGRAKRIVATDRGRQAFEIAARNNRAVGRRWAKQVGEERFAVFEEVLREITAAGPDDGLPR